MLLAGGGGAIAKVAYQQGSTVLAFQHRRAVCDAIDHET